MGELVDLCCLETLPQLLRTAVELPRFGLCSRLLWRFCLEELQRRLRQSLHRAWTDGESFHKKHVKAQNDQSRGFPASTAVLKFQPWP
eukprot:s326_g54.t1